MTTATTSNADKFRDEIDLLDKSGVGLILVRTREPHRADEALRTFSFGNRRPHRRWDIISGLVTYSRSDSAE